MLPKQYRLPKKEIENILRFGRHFNSENFSIKYKKTDTAPDIQNSRVCIIVSSKISKKAVKRNLIKRRLRYVLYLIFKKNPFKLDIVLIAKRGIVEKKYADIAQELERAFEQLLKC